MDQYGTLASEGKRHQLTFVRKLNHAPNHVWVALTEPEHVSVWFPADIEGERKLGAKLQFVFRENEGPTIDGEMREFAPPSLLEFSWGDEILRFELEPDGTGTKLTFINTFDELGKASRDAAGWHSCLDVLAAHLDAAPLPKDRWREVHPKYVELLGRDASTIGPPQ